MEISISLSINDYLDQGTNASKELCSDKK